jgi:hypothetical protein
MVNAVPAPITSHARALVEYNAFPRTQERREIASTCVCFLCCVFCLPISTCRSYDSCCSDTYPRLKRCWTIGMVYTEKPKPENICDLFFQAVGPNQWVYVINSGCCIKDCAASLPPLEQLYGPERQRRDELIAQLTQPPPPQQSIS